VFKAKNTKVDQIDGFDSRETPADPQENQFLRSHVAAELD
jgi:hypothetical protein